MKTHLNIKSVLTGIEYDKKLSRPLGILKRVLFHFKPVNQQKTTIFALILWEEQRLIRF